MATDSKTVQKIFGEVLRRLRTERGISQQDLALEADLDRTYISLLERGLRQPTLSTLIALAEAMGTDATLLVQHTTEQLDLQK
ncbi:XRE family transcriptional regulator [Stenotrophomonas sp. HMWF022]|uniref:helix-turn-helix domain-containing protein n=1 Tax=Stenotrophomonas sp. HMWF023 TaxID=2056859 RepID=UPI000D386FFD|nr:helix-turn-helix transcriptional regulator [Stenotrophomonas sp. HMWF023]PTS71938.1 XRE family transcriptional regulator [Stenotrophomonas sp. HMWF023]PTT53284.1 XRE family transcriptional regulator [Stenotrophomonas sp. HMWF022]